MFHAVLAFVYPWKYFTCGDGVDTELHVGAGAIQVVVEDEVQTTSGGGQ